MIKGLLLLMASLAGMVTAQATIPPPHPVEQFAGHASRSAMRAADDKKGVVAELKYEKLPDMSYARMGHQAFAAGNALVVTGGHTTGYALTQTAEVYENGQWQSLPIGSPHDYGFSVKTKDGNWMVGGGASQDSGKGRSSAVDVYNPQSKTFVAGPSLSKARALAKAINVNGHIFVSGNSEVDDPTIDYYDGSSFTAKGNTDNRSNPYMMPDKDGNIIMYSIYDTKGDFVELYTFSDGSQGLVADCYNPTTGETQYVATIFGDSRLPVDLAADARPSDCHFMINGENYYLTLAMELVSDEEYCYKLFAYCVEDGKYYQFGEFNIPSTHPITGEEISYRGGVIVNEARQEVYLIGASSTQWLEETVHIISMNYTTSEWTIASAPAFGYDLLQGSWTLMPDGRLACTGGFTDSSRHPSKEAYIFTPPVAGQSGSSPDTQTGGRTLVVLTKDNVKTEFLLADKPMVKFEGKSLRITSAKADVTYMLADIIRFTYINNNPTGITTLSEDEDPTEFSYADGSIVLSNLKKGALVAVYSLDGKLVQQLKANHQGTYRISLSSLPTGVYVVKADTITYKIMKR